MQPAPEVLDVDDVGGKQLGPRRPVLVDATDLPVVLERLVDLVNHVGAEPMQMAGGRLAQAGGTSGDERDLAVDVHTPAPNP